MSNHLARIIICVFFVICAALIAVLALVSDYPWITVPVGVLIVIYLGRVLAKDLRKLGGRP